MPAVIEISVQKEYEKNPEIKSEDVKQIREWMVCQPHLPNEHITDLDIILAYHTCEQYIDETKKLIDLNFSLRNLLSFYQKRNINQSLERALKTWLIAPLKTRTTKGYQAIYCQILNTDPSQFVYSDVVRAFVMIMDLWQLEEGTAPGVVVILNMDQVLLGHLYRIDLAVAQQFFFFLQLSGFLTVRARSANEASPFQLAQKYFHMSGCPPYSNLIMLLYVLTEAMFIRLKEFHIMNAPSFVDRLMGMVRPFMKTELLHKLRIHTVGSSSLDEYVSRHELSIEIDQILETKDQIWNKLKENAKFFEEESKKRVDEAKRSDNSLTMSKIFGGIEDTFRALQID